MLSEVKFLTLIQILRFSCIVNNSSRISLEPKKVYGSSLLYNSPKYCDSFSEPYGQAKVFLSVCGIYSGSLWHSYLERHLKSLVRVPCTSPNTVSVKSRLQIVRTVHMFMDKVKLVAEICQ